MSHSQVLRFEYQQSLSILSDRPGWSDALSISVRVLSEAITTGWYRSQFGKHAADFVILVSVVMHARPLTGQDLNYLINLGMARIEDEGRLYARVTDIGLADELGLHRQTIAVSASCLEEKGFLSILEIPDCAEGFRDSHGRFGGSKVYLLAGDLQQHFFQKEIQDRSEKPGLGTLIHDEKSTTVQFSDYVRAGKTGTVDAETTRHHDGNSDGPEENLSINQKDSEEDEEEVSFPQLVWVYFATAKGLTVYQPSQKERSALESLLQEGYSMSEIKAGVDSAFRRTRPRYFTLCARVIREIPPGSHPESCFDTPQRSKTAAARPEPDLLIETSLTRPATILIQAGEPLTAGQLARLRLMADRCEMQAKTVGSSGPEWLGDALARGIGVARPGNLLAYADAVLDDWIANGRHRPKKINHKSDRKPKTLKGHQVIAEYLRKRQGES